MGKERIAQSEINQIILLRQTGHSLPEIRRVVKRGNSPIFKYIKNVEILPQYLDVWRIKQGGSTTRILRERKNAEEKGNTLIPSLGKTEKLLIAACLYWGEGTKKDFNLSNSDPELIKTFFVCFDEK